MSPAKPQGAGTGMPALLKIRLTLVACGPAAASQPLGKSILSASSRAANSAKIVYKIPIN
jgi:hypothetical protein